MVKRQATAPDTEPEQTSFALPSEKEHLFQVVDLFDNSTDGNKFNLDIDTVIVKCEVVGGDEEGRGLLNRVSLDDKYKGFFATRLFLKSIGLENKGTFEIDTDQWQGRQFYATVIHNEGKNGKVFANIKEYNFDKMVDNPSISTEPVSKNEKEVEWDADL